MRTTLEAHTAALKRYSKSAKREAKVQYLSGVSTKATAEGGAARQLRKLMATSRDAKRARDTGFNKHVRAGSKTDATVNAYFRAKNGDNLPKERG
ncbi:hypothetical protein Atoyac15_19 [Aeromonas phage Atoyac15]|uniref:Uncharacterized protein n=1 Tax=Aeromonas phage Atoyac15 TaxID=2767551 RepID=A0A866D290_9CAUD|nr:hypothetical protein Atoyac15_19 [Aeromonas phage Atoyac15]